MRDAGTSSPYIVYSIPDVCRRVGRTSTRRAIQCTLLYRPIQFITVYHHITLRIRHNDRQQPQQHHAHLPTVTTARLTHPEAPGRRRTPTFPYRLIPYPHALRVRAVASGGEKKSASETSRQFLISRFLFSVGMLGLNKSGCCCFLWGAAMSFGVPWPQPLANPGLTLSDAHLSSQQGTAAEQAVCMFNCSQ